MRVAANWVPVLRRGRAIGVIGTGYQMTQGLTYLVAGWAAHEYGWRGALYVPAGLLIFAAVIMLLLLEESPREESKHEAVDLSPTSVLTIEPRGTWTENILVTLSNGRLWLLGISLGLLNACRYGFIDWGLTHLKEVQVTTVKDAALKYALLPVGAMVGSYIAGWMTDRFFGGRRAPVICLLLFALSGLSLVYSEIVTSSPKATLALLVAIGFCIYGPQVLLVGTAPADLARRGTSAAAAGFVNFLGYMGAASGDVVTGYLLKHYDWTTTIYVWGGWAFAAAIAAAALWNATAHQEAIKSSEPEA